MKRSWPYAVLALLTIMGCAGGDDMDDGAAADMDAPASADPDLSPSGEATGLPAGYAVRFDREGSDPADFQVAEAAGALEVRTGPAGILYNESHTVAEGSYTVSATFTEIGAPPNHREAFGLIIGGSDLQGDAQAYTYFLVRADGSYLIKQRNGGQTSDVSPNGWNPADAVNQAAEAGDVTNALSIQVRGEQAHFLVNGTEVAVHPVANIDAYGVAGVRINHNLNVRVESFEVSS